MNINFRADKGSELSYNEMDSNLGSLFYSSSISQFGDILYLHYAQSAQVPIERPPHVIPLRQVPQEAPQNILYGSASVMRGATDFVYDEITSRVGVGTLSPKAKLHVVGDTSISGSSKIGNQVTDIHLLKGKVGINSDELLTYALEVSGSIRASENIIAFSDRRLKKDIKLISNPIKIIGNITGNTYSRVGAGSAKINRKFAGLIAQELLEVFPEAVFEDDRKILGVDYNAVVALLVEVTKRQQKEIDILKTRLNKNNIK